MHEIIGKHKSTLDTPCLVIDKKLLNANLMTLQQDANLANKNVRPHAKTHKCTKICRQQIETGAVGICVTKVSEAVILAEQNFKNTLITSPVVTSTKINNLMYCLKKDPQLTIVLDNIQNATTLNLVASNNNLKLNVLIDIDAGIGRTGIAFQNVLGFAQALCQFTSLNLKGIQCYAGNLQHIEDYKSRYNASTEVMKKAGKCINQLAAAGFNSEILTGSGTGTYEIDMQIPEVTEIQPGSYTVMDAEYFAIDSSKNVKHNKKFQPALTLITSVISANHATHVTCDAGWKALYEVPTKPLILNPKGYLYDWGGFGDEHGKITAVNNNKLPKLGDRLELMVAHCDPTINMYDYFYITENDIVVDVWPIDMRGKSQ